MTPESFEQLCIDFGFCSQGCKSLTENYAIIKKHPDVYGMLEKIYKRYEVKEQFSFYAEQESFERACSSISVHPYSAQMIFYLFLSPLLEKFYKEKGFAPSMFEGVKKGIKCKLDECYNVYGIYGSFVAIWFSRFFTFTLFPIGRLEFAPYIIDYDVTCQDKTICKGDRLIDVHIPSRGPLLKEEVESAEIEAIAFFENYYQCSFKGFFCESWLLYPENYKVIPQCKNIVAFMDRFNIFKSHPDPSNDDLWRIFGSSALYSDPARLERSTYMQKQFASYIEDGGSLGIGFGIRCI